MYLSRDIDFSSELSLGDLFVARDQYPEKGTFFLAETFRIF
jgi:hypothetical protein